MTELEDLRVRNRELGKRLAECSVGAIELAETISRLRTENKCMAEETAVMEFLRKENLRLNEAITEALDALEEHYDIADGDDGRPLPNDFMRIGEALVDASGRRLVR